jgi:hypothetical protein
MSRPAARDRLTTSGRTDYGQRMTTPQEEPARDPAVARLIERRVAVVASDPPLWREPLRLTVILSTAVVVVGTFLPWLHQEGIGQTVVRTGNSGYADGTFLSIVAVISSLVVASRGVARSRSWLLRWLPAILGTIALLFVLGAWRGMENQIDIWRRFGATGVYEPGFFIVVAAGTLLGVSDLVIGSRRGRAATTDGVPNEPLRIRGSSVVTALLTLIGVVAGVLAGSAVALGLGLPPAAVGIPLVALAVVGGAVGGVVASRVARILTTPRAGSG